MLKSVEAQTMPPNAWLWSMISSCSSEEDIKLLFQILQKLRVFVSPIHFPRKLECVLLPPLHALCVFCCILCVPLGKQVQYTCMSFNIIFHNRCSFVGATTQFEIGMRKISSVDFRDLISVRHTHSAELIQNFHYNLNILKKFSDDFEYAYGARLYAIG